MIIPTKVSCRYGILGIGFHDEVYDRRDVNSVAAWHLNSGLYPQLAIATVESVETDAIEGKTFLARLREINDEARVLARKLRKKIEA